MSLKKRLNFRDDEALIEIVRRSKCIIALPLVIGTVLIVLAFFLIVPLFDAGVIGIIGFVALLVMGCLVMLRALWFWHRTAFIITNIRVIDIDQSRLFHRSVGEARYGRIEDISVQVRGILSTLFRLGNLRVQTINASSMLELRHVAAPERVHDLLSRLQHEVVQAQQHTRSPSPFADLAAWSDGDLQQLRDRIDGEVRNRTLAHGSSN